MYFHYLISLFFLLATGVNSSFIALNKESSKANRAVIMGAEQITAYLPYLKGKNVGFVINNNALINGKLSIDTLNKLGVNMVKRYGAERLLKDKNGVNLMGNGPEIPLIFLYGDKYKPTKQDLEGIDVMLFDVQDLGVRFYIYLSTLHYVMEACAENNIELIILDRPNPIGSFVDGPVLDKTHASFLGTDPIPMAHGLTLGEYAQMINGEGWLKEGITCKIKVIKMLNYSHGMRHHFINPPFPNLNSQKAIQLYPSLCWFDGTVISQGRGTNYPFTVLGHPLLKNKYPFSFRPTIQSNGNTSPPYFNTLCYGINLENYDTPTNRIQLNWLTAFYKAYPEKILFFNVNKFDKIAGTLQLRAQISKGMSEVAIRKTWQFDLNAYKKIRNKYLMYNEL